MKKILEKVDIDAKHLKKILTILKMRAPDSTLIAFGSRVEFTAKPNSDLDLAIICDKKTAQKAIPRIVDDFQESNIPFNIDILDYNRLPDNMKKNIDRQFIEIYRPEQKKIPAGWTETTIQDVAVINELTVKNGNAPTVIEYIDIASVDKGQITEKQIMPFNKAPSRAKRIVRDNDILISTVRPNLEHYTFVKTTSKNTIASTGFAVVSAKKVDSRFLYYILTQKSFTEYLTRIAEGHTSAYPAFNPDVIENAKIQIPSLSEQKAIAHILGSLDDKIELNRQMNRILEAMAQAIFKSWFIDFDPVLDNALRAGNPIPESMRERSEMRKIALPAPQSEAARQAGGLPAEIADMFPNSFEESELGLVPKGWKVKTISDLTDIVGGSTPRTTELVYWQDGVHSWATPKDLSALSVPLLLETERRITDAGLSQISSGLLPVGTVLLSSRAPIGYLVIAEIPVAINQGFIAMKPKKDISNLFVLFWTAFAHDDILSRANGSTFLEISKTNFRQISLVAPPSMIIRAFDQRVREMYNRIVDNERESRTLEALRDTLLPKLISGELRMPDVEAILKEAGL